MALLGWQKAQKKRQEKKRLSLARKVFSLIVFALLLGIGFQIWGSLRKSVWDGSSRLTIAFNASPLLMVSLEPHDKTMSLLTIPDETYLETIHGYGFYQAGTIWRLGEMEEINGGELLAGSLQEYFGAPVEAYGSVPPSFSFREAKIREDLSTVVWFWLKGKGETNLTRWDLIRLWLGMKRVRFDKISWVDLRETEGVSEVTLPDGTQALESDPLALDRLVSRLFVDPKIKKEALAIGVFNATDHPGLAKKAARLINNLGGQVVSAGDWSGDNQAQTEVRCAKADYKKYTSWRLMNLFQGQSVSEREEGSQVEILLILGEDYWQRLMAK